MWVREEEKKEKLEEVEKEEGRGKEEEGDGGGGYMSREAEGRDGGGGLWKFNSSLLFMGGSIHAITLSRNALWWMFGLSARRKMVNSLFHATKTYPIPASSTVGSLKPQRQLISLWTRDVSVDHLDARVVDDTRCVVGVDRSEEELHLLHRKMTPHTHPAPTPKCPEPPCHLLLALLTRLHPSLRLPFLRLWEHIGVSVQTVRLRTYPDAAW